MADLSQVERAIVDVAASALFPGIAYQDADYQPSAAGGTICSLYRGFPTQAVLDADLAAGKAHVSVFVQPNMTRLMTPYQDYWRTLPYAPATLTVATSGSNVTFGGTAGAGHIAGVKFGNATAAYIVQASDTPESVALALYEIIVALVPDCTQTGAVIQFPTDTGLVGRVVQTVPAFLETRWQDQGFTVSCWCPDPLSRDAVTGIVDNAFAATRWLALADGSAGHLLYQRTVVFDNAGRDKLWRRDLFYRVQYPTTLIEQQPEMMFGDLEYHLGQGPGAPPLTFIS